MHDVAMLLPFVAPMALAVSGDLLLHAVPVHGSSGFICGQLGVAFDCTRVIVVSSSGDA